MEGSNPKQAGRAPAETGGASDGHRPTGVVYDDVFLLHDTPAGFPERPERLTAIVQHLADAGLLRRLTRVETQPAGLEWLTTVHDAAYVRRVEAACRDGTPYLDTPDVPISADSYRAAVAAAGGVLAAVDAVMAGQVANAFCAVRPPGHHARPSEAMGFCLFNNVAVAVRYLQQQHALAKVLVVDWDVHHGNGTAEALQDDPSATYFSIHRWPFYPGTGHASDAGRGTINVPLHAGAGDDAYLGAIQHRLLPAAEEFEPDFVLISAGFDAHQSDPLGGMAVTAEGFARMTELVKSIARRYCRGRLVSVLEGGYDLTGLAQSVEAHLRVLMG